MTTKILGICRYVIIGIAVVLSCVGMFVENEILSNEGLSNLGKLITVLPPIICLVLVIIDEILVHVGLYKRHFISYLSLWGLVFSVGLNPIANLTQGVFRYPILALASFFFIVTFVLTIVYDNQRSKEENNKAKKNV